MAIKIVGLVFLLTGLPFLWIAKRAMARDRAIARWPRADGVVTSSTLAESQGRVTDQNTGLYHYRTYYSPSVRYTYTVGAETFEGTSIARALDNLSTSEEAAKKIIDKYPVDARVSVFYDAADPKTAYLEVSRRAGPIVLVVFGMFWVVLGGFILTLAFT